MTKFLNYFIKEKQKRLSAGFSLIEVMVSLTLVSIFHVIAVEFADPFYQRVNHIMKRAGDRNDMLRLDIFLDDLANASSYIDVPTPNEIFFYKSKDDTDILARCLFDRNSIESLACIFYKQGEQNEQREQSGNKIIPIYNGRINDAKFEIENLYNIKRFRLDITLDKSYKLYFGKLPAVI